MVYGSPPWFLQVDLIQYIFILATRYLLQINKINFSFRDIRNKNQTVQYVPMQTKNVKDYYFTKILSPTVFNQSYSNLSSLLLTNF